MIDYQYIDDIKADDTWKNVVITDGTISISGTMYTVSGQTVVITNDLIESGFAIHQRLCTQDQLRFGSCESAECSMNIFDNIPTLKDKVLKVYIYVNRDASTMLQLGVFKVTQDRLSADRTKRQILMYDAMHDILNADVKSWYDTILPNANSSVTVKQFRDSFLNYFSITPENTTLINDGIVIKRSIEADTLSGADVINYICEFNGCFGTITNEGKFRFLYLSQDIDRGLFPSDTLYPSDSLYPQDINHAISNVQKSRYFSITFEDYLCDSITRLVVRTDTENGSVTVGTEGNTYAISSNFLFYGLSSSVANTAATNILSKITNCYYKACNVECIGNPCIELGDPIRISTTYRGIVTYILEKNMTGIKLLTDTYTARGKQKYEEDVTSVQSQIKQTNGRVSSLKVDADGIRMDVSNLETATRSAIRQLDTEISFKVSQGAIMDGLATETASSGIKITPNAIAVNSSGTFTVDSENFKLDSDGHVTISDGVIELLGGAAGDLYIDDQGFRSYNYRGASITIASGEMICGDGASNTTLYGGYLMVSGGGPDFTEINGGDVDFVSANISNGGIDNNHTLRRVYWRKVADLSDDEYVICGGGR